MTLVAQTPLRDARYGSERLGVSLARFYEMARTGVLPPGVAVRLGRQLRVDPARLDAWIASGGQSLPSGWRA